MASIPTAKRVQASEIGATRSVLPQVQDLSGITAGAKGLEQLGADISGAGNDFAVLGAAIQQREETRQDQKQQNILKASLLDDKNNPDTGWKRLQLDDAISGQAGIVQRRKDLITAQAKTIEDFDARQRFLDQAEGAVLIADADHIEHVTGERSKARVATNETTMALATEELIGEVDSPVVIAENVIAKSATIAIAAGKVADDLGFRKGSRERDLFVRMEQTKAWDKALTFLIDDGKEGIAQELYDNPEIRASLLGETRGKLAKSLLSGTRTSLAQGAADKAFALHPKDRSKGLDEVRRLLDGDVEEDGLVILRRRYSDAVATDIAEVERRNRAERLLQLIDSQDARARSGIAETAAIAALENNELDPTAAFKALDENKDLDPEDRKAAKALLTQLFKEAETTEEKEFKKATVAERRAEILANEQSRVRPSKALSSAQKAVADNPQDETKAFKAIDEDTSLKAKDKVAAKTLVTALFNESRATSAEEERIEKLAIARANAAYTAEERKRKNDEAELLSQVIEKSRDGSVEYSAAEQAYVDSKLGLRARLEKTAQRILTGAPFFSKQDTMRKARTMKRNDPAKFNKQDFRDEVWGPDLAIRDIEHFEALQDSADKEAARKESQDNKKRERDARVGTARTAGLKIVKSLDKAGWNEAELADLDNRVVDEADRRATAGIAISDSDYALIYRTFALKLEETRPKTKTLRDEDINVLEALERKAQRARKVDETFKFDFFAGGLSGDTFSPSERDKKTFQSLGEASGVFAEHPTAGIQEIAQIVQFLINKGLFPSPRRVRDTFNENSLSNVRPPQ